MRARLRDIYEAFDLPYDVRNARKFLKDLNPKKGYSKMKKISGFQYKFFFKTRFEVKHMDVS